LGAEVNVDLAWRWGFDWGEQILDFKLTGED